MDHNISLLATLVWAVGFGLFAQVAAHRWQIPAIVLLLFGGVLLGPTALDLVHPAALGPGLAIMVKLAVAVILFEGALNLRLPVLKSSLKEIRNLTTFGVLITWILTALAAHFIAGLQWTLAIVFGALMTVTGPTVVQPLLKRLNITKRIKAILEGEAILIDPIGAILAVAALDVILGLQITRDVGFFAALWAYFGRLIVGAVVGGMAAVLLAKLQKTPHLIPAELNNLVVLAFVWSAFAAAEVLHSEAGIMSSVVMGLLLQRETLPGERQLRHFKETLTILSISVLFVLLAANLKLDTLLQEGVRGFLTVAIIMFVIRPVSVFLSLWKTTLNMREKLFIAWIGPRGIIAASVASLFGLTLAQVGIAAAERLPALTFLAIIMTVTVQGLSAAPLARLLKLQSLEGRRVVIVGANRLGRAIAQLIARHGRPVTLVDSNPTMAQAAAAENLSVVQGNALDENIMELSGLEDAETIVAVTANPEVNVLIAQAAQESFGIGRAFLALKSPHTGTAGDLLKHTRGRLGFGRAIRISAWESDPIHDLLWKVPQTWLATAMDKMEMPEELLPVLCIRAQSAEVVHSGQIWQPGDEIAFLTRLSPEAAQQCIETCLPDVR